MASFKKCLAVFVAVLVLASSFMATTISVGAAQVTENGVTYSLDNKSMTARVASYTSLSSADEVVIPAEVNGYAVVEIFQSAFLSNLDVVSVTLPDTILSIGGFAFDGCSNLENVNISSDITSVGVAAFRNCTKLTEIDLGNALVSIGSAAFKSSGVKEIVIPDSCTTIGGTAFYDCKKLEKVVLSNSITVISNDLFNKCSALTEVNIPDSVTSIEEDAFNRCTSLVSVEIGKNVENLNLRAFYGCSSLRSVVMSDAVQEISEAAFYGCKGLTIYGVRDSVAHEFAKSKKFDFIGYEIGAESTATITAFESSKTEITIPETLCAVAVTAISSDAFKGNTKIKAITFNSNVTYIPDYAFAGCTALESVKFAAEDTFIGKYAFADCTSIKNVCLPEGMATLDEGAFGYVSNAQGNYVVSDDFCIYGAINSTAYDYCVANGVQFRFGLLKEVASGEIVMGMNYTEKAYEIGDEYQMINILGDVNDDGYVNIKDATQIQKASAGLVSLDELAQCLADTTLDGKYNVKDATQIQKYVASLIDSFYK